MDDISQEGTQSKLNEMVVQFQNSNIQYGALLLKLERLRDILTGTEDLKEVLSDSVDPMVFGIVPKFKDCLSDQSNHNSRFEVLLKELSQYV